MAQTPLPIPTDQTPEGDAAPTRAPWLVALVVTLFFAWGFATVLIDTLIPKLKGLFALNYAQAMLTQFAFFIAYFLVSIPAGILLSKIGYLRGIVVGLAVMAGGCLLFSPAAGAGVYWGFLVALFIMAAGITTLQVAANPLIALVGAPGKSHFRLNLAQAFNSLGTFIGPRVGAAIILKNGVTPPDPRTTPAAALEAYRAHEAQAVQTPFLGIAAVLALLGVAFWFARRSPAAPSARPAEGGSLDLRLLGRPRLAMGVLAIFLYVGAEVTIGSLMVSFLIQPQILHATAEDAGKLVSFYWGAAMVGRLLGSLALYLKAPAARVLSLCALGAITLVAVAGFSTGWLAAGAIIAVGLCNSIMFPTIFTLAIDGLGPKTSQGSGLLCMAIVGGAVIPLTAGAIADRGGLAAAFIIPALCYLYIALYGRVAAGPARADLAAIPDPI